MQEKLPMLSLLVLSQDLQKNAAYAQTLCEEDHIDPFDRNILDVEGTIGIEDIRKLQTTVFLKALKGEKKAVIIYHAETLTSEAQNALLKILEEPPLNTQIILLAKTDGSFLPTILSRCKIVKLDTSNPTLSEEDLHTAREEFTKILTLPIGAKLAKAQQLAENKEETLIWLFAILQAYRLHMLTHPDNHTSVNQTQLLQQAYTTITTTNINLRFLLENLFLQLSV